MSSTLRVPPVVYLLGLTIFSLTTAEFMVAGMMPALSAALDVSLAKIGNLISLYALGMAVGGPVVNVLLQAMRVPDKTALLGLLLCYAAGGAMAAAAPQYEVMAWARIIMGVASSACIGVSLTICADVVSVQMRGRAVAVVLMGLMFAPVFGVPGTVLIEQAHGWRVSFWAVVALSLLCTCFVAWRVPKVYRDRDAGLAAQLRALCGRSLWAAYFTSACIIGGTFAAFSFFAPILTQVSGFDAEHVPMLLLAYGIANVIGNVVVGRLADRYTLRVLAAGLTLLAGALAVFALFAGSAAVSLLACMLVGLAGVPMNPAMVARVMRAAPPSPLVNTMHASCITAGLAFGSWASGYTIDLGLGLRAPLWVGAAMALVGLLSLVPYAMRRCPVAQPLAASRT